jgi:hypothetical protein
MTQPRDEEFFVGYLALSPRLRRNALTLGAAAMLLLLAAGFALARTSAGAGKAKFAFAQSRGDLGLLTTAPEATFWTLDPSVAGGVRGTLLARQGKFGLPPSSMDGHVVRVRGTQIERDGRRMIELAATPELADDALSQADRAQLLAPAARDLGPVSLSGEIVDSKCYLGRMRPGDHRTHRACAQQCIAGGIPPLFVTRDARGVETQYLLATPAGQSIAHSILPFVAEPVLVQGRLIAQGDLLIIQTSIDRVVRL